jgi:hypothetical protein
LPALIFFFAWFVASFFPRSSAAEMKLFTSFFHRFFFSNTLKARGRKHENSQRKSLWLKYFVSRAFIKEMLDERRGNRRVASAHPMKFLVGSAIATRQQL